MKERCPSEVRTDLRGPVGRWMRQPEHQRVRRIFRIVPFRLLGVMDDSAVNILRGKERRQIADHELGEPSVSRDLQTQTPCHRLELAPGSAGKRIEPVDGQPILRSAVVTCPQNEGFGVSEGFGIGVPRRVDQPRPDVPGNSLILPNLASRHS